MRGKVVEKIEELRKNSPLLLFSLFKEDKIKINGKKIALEKEELEFLKEKIHSVIEEFVHKGEYKKIVSLYTKSSLFKHVPDDISEYAFDFITKAFENYMGLLAERGNPFALKDIYERNEGYSSLYSKFSQNIPEEKRKRLDELMEKDIQEIIDKNYLSLYHKAANKYVDNLIKSRKGKNLVMELEKIASGSYGFEDFPSSAKNNAAVAIAEGLKRRFNPRKIRSKSNPNKNPVKKKKH